jgi:hypothetical protein
MAWRPTPLGICSGIGMIEIGNETTLSIDADARATRMRPDMTLLFEVVKELESSEDRGRVRFVTNGAAIESGGRLYVTNVELTNATLSGEDTVTEQRPVSLRNTEGVKYVREIATTLVPYDSIVDKFAHRFQISTEVAQRAIDQLIEAGVLISELRVSPLDDPIGYLLSRIGAISPKRGSALNRALVAAEQLDAKPFYSRTFASYSAIINGFAALVEKPPGQVVQIDLQSPLKGTLNRMVLSEAAKLGEYWIGLGVPVTLSRFRERFVARYEGSERMVPLLDLVDPSLGLGVPETLAPAQVQSRERDALVVRLACAALRDRSEEIELSMEDLATLSTPLQSDESLGSIEIGFQIAAASHGAIDRGEYRIVPSSFEFSTRAGKSFGRFMHLFESQVKEKIRHLANVNREPDAITAEFSYAPPTVRSYNVLIRPQMFDAELRVGIGGPPAVGELMLSDLWVGLEGERFFLWSKSRQRRVAPTESHLFSTSRFAPNLCRFLSMLSCDGKRLIQGFPWGSAALLPVLPRVRVGRVVLSPRSWMLPTSELGDSSHTTENALKNWRSEWSLPRYVFLQELDQNLPIDLESTVAGQLLLDQVASDSSTFRLTEVLPEPSENWIQTGEGASVAEFVISLVSKPLDGVTQPRPRPIMLQPRPRQGPGSEWIYVKLYVGKQAAEDLLIRQIKPMLKDLLDTRDVERWFFVRYVDPDYHLRLRLRAASERASVTRERILKTFETWLRSEELMRYSIDTYDPEYERYGGVDAIDAVERFFEFDSNESLQLIASTSETPDVRVEASVESFSNWLAGDDLSELGLKAFDLAPRRTLPPLDRIALKRLNVRVLDPVNAGVRDALLGDRDEERLLSLFHMHCNRLGIETDVEPRAVALLRALLLARKRQHPFTM